MSASTIIRSSSEAKPAQGAPDQVQATGRRKSAVAHVWMQRGAGRLMVNGRNLEEYFPRESLRTVISQPFEVTGTAGRFDIRARITGGGLSGQAGALRHAISRAIERSDDSKRPELKKAGLLTRDARRVERKKYGQRGARARFQFSKR